jgi:hypothetical protein
MMLALAVHYLDADPSRQHSFPFGASILQLLLNRQNTRAFRLDRDEWREAVVAYAGATLGIVGDCGQRMLKISKTPYPEEFTFIIEDAIPLVEDYLDENPSDERVRKSLETLRTAVEQSNLLRPPPVIIHTERDVDPRRVGCVSLLIGVIFSLIAGSWAFFLYRMAGEISGWPATVISVLAILSSFFLIGGFRLRFGDQTRYDRWTKH